MHGIDRVQHSQFLKLLEFFPAVALQAKIYPIPIFPYFSEFRNKLQMIRRRFSASVGDGS